MGKRRFLLQKIFILFSFNIFLLITFPVFSQSKPIVYVDPIVNLSDETWLEAVCDSVTDNVVFTLKLLGSFNVKSDTAEEVQTINIISDNIDVSDTSSLKVLAEAAGYDDILFGSCTIKDGAYVITISAYDLLLDKIIYSGSTEVESIFDTFEAVDEITYQTIEGFSGKHITYGSLVFIPPTTGEPFSFTIDGIALPKGTFSVDRMPAGVHELEVSQERPLGLYRTNSKIEVKEEKENRIILTLPNIAGEEITVFNQADRYLTLLSMGEKTGVVLAMNNLNNLLESSFFKKYRPELVRKYKIWVSMLDRKVEVLERKSLNLSIRPLLSEVNQNIYNDNVSLTSEYASLFLSKDELKNRNIFIPDFKEINVDGKSDDWKDVSTVFRDNTGDFSTILNKGAGQDILWVGIAVDNKRIYFAMETVSNVYRNDFIYRMTIKSGDFLTLNYDGRYKTFNVGFTPNGDWGKAKFLNSKDSSVRGAKKDIIEISFPLNQIEKWFKKDNYEIKIDFFAQSGIKPYPDIDRLSVKSLIPSIYSAFKAIKQ